jgi:predicted phage tail protein
MLHPVEPGKTPTLVWSTVGETIEYALEQAADPAFDEPTTVYAGRGASWTVPINQTRPGMYYYRVRATSDGGPGPWSEVQTVEIQAPPPPRPHLGAPNYGYTHGSYELRWQPVPGALRYELQQVEETRGEETVLETGNATFRFDSQPIGQYTYRVRACNEFVCSEWSNEQAVHIAPQPPATAPDLELEGPLEDGTVRLVWTELPDATEYEVEMSEEPDFRNARVMTQPQPGMETIRREPGSLYVRVCGANTGGSGPWSNVASIQLAPDAPGWIEADVTDRGRVQVSWGAVAGRASYTVEVEATTGKTTTRQEIYHGSETQFEMALPGVVDWAIFRVRAGLPGVQSAWQASDPIQLGTGPEAPWIETPDVDEKSMISLQWSPVSGADSYILEAARSEDFKDVKTQGGIPGSSIFFPAPSSGKYWFRVKAVHPSGTSRPSNIVSVNVRRPAPPHLWPLDPVSAGAPFEVKWKGMPDYVYYELEVSADLAFPDGAAQMKRIFHPSQKLEMPGRAPGKLYFRVRAVDGQHEPSVWSDVLAVEIV